MSNGFFKNIREDIDSYIDRDPAARSRLEVFLCYPGFHAMIYYRLGSLAWRKGWKLLARFISHFGKLMTTIEIHPGAKIGHRLFIDHGTGVVIGETAEIGDDVTLYQGVTLGGTSLEKGKRHPTLEDGVIVGSGAQVLGPLTVGAGARIGANAVVLKDVPAGATMVGIPARMVMAKPSAEDKTFQAYAVSNADMPDPIARAFDNMRSQLQTLMDRVAELEAEKGSAEAGSSEPSADEEPGANDDEDRGAGRIAASSD